MSCERLHLSEASQFLEMLQTFASHSLHSAWRKKPVSKPSAWLKVAAFRPFIPSIDKYQRITPVRLLNKVNSRASQHS
jgi:hypothetical protein